MVPPNATGKPHRVLFLTDCGPEVGGGHVMRCLSLAEALAARGAVCGFLAPPEVARVLDVFAGPEVERLTAKAGSLQWLVEAGAETAKTWRADAVVVDHYGLGGQQETLLRPGGARIVAIDDLAARRHDCDLLIDATLGRSSEAYAALIPAPASALTGPAYALLRPEYADGRGAALARRRPAAPPRRLLVSLGLMDFRGVTGRVMNLIRPALDELQVDIVVGSGASTVPWLRHVVDQDARLTLHVDTRDMAGLIAAADIGIGAGGSSTWERAALGLPSLSLILADNQQAVALELDRRGAAVAVETRGAGFAEALPQAFARLLGDGAFRTRLAETSAALCDGAGAARAADAILALVAQGKA
jgi:UDP-2,4-diacetamido-2,4,6-trideoxy-beta-L-altropyranose hydrolase